MNIHSIETAIRSKLVASKGDWVAIAQESGVSYSWISKFVNGHIPNPGLQTLSNIEGWFTVSEINGGTASEATNA